MQRVDQPQIIVRRARQRQEDGGDVRADETQCIHVADDGIRWVLAFLTCKSTELNFTDHAEQSQWSDKLADRQLHGAGVFDQERIEFPGSILSHDPVRIVAGVDDDVNQMEMPQSWETSEELYKFCCGDPRLHLDHFGACGLPPGRLVRANGQVEDGVRDWRLEDVIEELTQMGLAYPIDFLGHILIIVVETPLQQP